MWERGKWKEFVLQIYIQAVAVFIKLIFRQYEHTPSNVLRWTFLTLK